MFLGTQECVTEGFLRVPWCRSAHTHIRVQRAVCMHQHVPESVPSNGHDVNVLHPSCMVLHLSHVGCNTPSQMRVFVIILKMAIGVSFTICRASCMHVQTQSFPILWLSSWPFDLHFQLSQVVSVPFGHVP